MNEKLPLQVLLVEDQTLLGEVIVGLLELEEMNVEAVENGRLAVEKLKVNRYDLVITDLMMPEMDGVQLLEWIRLEAKSTVPVIVLSANADLRFTHRMQDLGVLSVLQKPLDIEQFGATIVALMPTNA